MVKKGRKKGTVRFVFKPQGIAKQVRLLGDFTEWAPVTMRKQKDATFVATLPLEAGVYEYRFMVDGEWQGDPDGQCWAPNPFGTMNSVARID
jgi:1,4-alpha-glucan branching enzyme